MKITEAKLRKMIRGVIREFTTSAKGTGVTKTKLGKGDSAKTKTAKSAETAAKSTYSTKHNRLKS